MTVLPSKRELVWLPVVLAALLVIYLPGLDNALVPRWGESGPEGPAVKLLGIPLKLSETPGTIRRPPPRLGEHTDEILAELGYSAAKIDELRQEGVV